MDQLENLKALYANIRKIFEEITFTRPARITDKAFKWLTIYTFALLTVPSFIATLFEAIRSFVLNSCLLLWDILLAIDGVAALVFLSMAIVLMLRVVHVGYHAAFDYEEPLETVRQDDDLPHMALLYTMSINWIDAIKQNIAEDEKRSKQMIQSYHSFYWSVALGMCGFVASKLYLYILHG